MKKHIAFLSVLLSVCCVAYSAEKKVIVKPGDVMLQNDGSGLGKKLNIENTSTNLSYWLQKLIEGLDKMRNLPNDPYDNEVLYHIQRLGKQCGELAGFRDIPNQSRFTGSNKNAVVVKVGGIVEYYNYGDLDNKLNGYIKAVSGALYVELKFGSTKQRCTIFRGHISRFGELTGNFAVETWNRRKMCWKTQCSLDSVFVARSISPLSGTMKVGGIDPWGRSNEKTFVFPVNIINEKGGNKK